MRCPNCNEEIAEGFLYCQKCGFEIQIVPDYNPIVEDVLSGSLKDVFEDKKIKDEKPEIKSEAVKKPEHKRFSKRKAFIAFLLISLVAGGIYSIYLKNVRKDSFEYQYEQAVVMYDKKEYGKGRKVWT